MYNQCSHDIFEEPPEHIFILAHSLSSLEVPSVSINDENPIKVHYNP